MNKTLATLAAASLATSAFAGEPRAISAPGPQGALAGTLIPPAEGRPVILILPGSGPTDRNGNNPMGVTAASYRLLAESLAERGIGSVRIDKRGMFGSAGAIPDPNNVTISAYADDVEAWITAAKAETGAPCIWVLGHSEGGLIALEAAQREMDLCGILLVASVGRPIGTIMREQLQANPANIVILDEAMAAIGSLEAGERVDVTGMHPALQSLFAPPVQGFLIDMMRFNPAELAALIDEPMLIVAGGKDLQTPVSDGEALASAQPDATLVILPDMNHVLKSVEGDSRAANLAAYSDSSRPIAPGLVETIAAFVTGEGAP